MKSISPLIDLLIVMLDCWLVRSIEVVCIEQSEWNRNGIMDLWRMEMSSKLASVCFIAKSGAQGTRQYAVQ